MHTQQMLLIAWLGFATCMWIGWMLGISWSYSEKKRCSCDLGEEEEEGREIIVMFNLYDDIATLITLAGLVIFFSCLSLVRSQYKLRDWLKSMQDANNRHFPVGECLRHCRLTKAVVYLSVVLLYTLAWQIFDRILVQKRVDVFVEHSKCACYLHGRFLFETALLNIIFLTLLVGYCLAQVFFGHPFEDDQLLEELWFEIDLEMAEKIAKNYNTDKQGEECIANSPSLFASMHKVNSALL